MNLFLLVAVPLATVALVLWLKPTDPALRTVRTWGEGAAIALGSLIVISFFGKIREFTGDGSAVFWGLVWTDVILVPGVMIASWMIRRVYGPWVLVVWLAMAFGAESLRDVIWGSRLDDATELFFSPVNRLILIALIPLVVSRAVQASEWTSRGLWIAASVGLVLSRPCLALLSYSGGGLFVVILESIGLAGAVLWLVRGGLNFNASLVHQNEPGSRA